MAKVLCVCLLVCLTARTVLSESADACETVDGGRGSCVSIFECQLYLKILQERSSQYLQVLEKAHCGFEGKNSKVCCPPPRPITTTTTAATPAVLSKLGSHNFLPALPDPPVCGVSNASFSRIVGGVNASLDDFPWMALLGFKIDNSTTWGCGGSLISSRHVLTAAHCIHNYETSLYVVRLGEIDLASEDDGASPIDVFIKQMIAHEQYNANKISNDIGILILADDVQFTNSIRPICMPKDSNLRANSYEDYSPLVAGWGRTKYDGLPATHLQVVQLPVVSNDFCADAYKSYKTQVFDQTVICAGHSKGGKDACKGDSGGPLMQPIWSVEDKKAYFYAIGLVSYASGCAQALIPGVYTRVTHFIPWIEEKVLGSTAT